MQFMVPPGFSLPAAASLGPSLRTLGRRRRRQIASSRRRELKGNCKESDAKNLDEKAGVFTERMLTDTSSVKNKPDELSKTLEELERAVAELQVQMQREKENHNIHKSQEQSDFAVVAAMTEKMMLRIAETISDRAELESKVTRRIEEMHSHVQQRIASMTNGLNDTMKLLIADVLISVDPRLKSIELVLSDLVAECRTLKM